MTRNDASSAAPTVRKAGRPRRAGADEAVLTAARNLLAKDGYEKMTIEDVAAAAGVTRPMIYRRWPSKAELAIAAVARMVRAEPATATGNVAADLLTAANQLQSRFIDTNYLGMLGAAIVERERHPEIFELFHERLLGPRRRWVRAVLMDGIDTGQVDVDVDVDVLVSMFVGSFYAAMFAGSSDAHHDWAQRVTDSTMQLIDCASYRRSRRAPAPTRPTGSL